MIEIEFFFIIFFMCVIILLIVGRNKEIKIFVGIWIFCFFVVIFLVYFGFLLMMLLIEFVFLVFLINLNKEYLSDILIVLDFWEKIECFFVLKFFCNLRNLFNVFFLNLLKIFFFNNFDIKVKKVLLIFCFFYGFFMGWWIFFRLFFL